MLSNLGNHQKTYEWNIIFISEDAVCEILLCPIYWWGTWSIENLSVVKDVIDFFCMWMQLNQNHSARK